LVRAAARKADKNARASPASSMYSKIPSVAESSNRKSSSSPKPTPMPPPSDITDENPIPIGAAKSSIAALTAPDCATSARRPRIAGGAQYVAFNPISVRMTPSAQARQDGSSVCARLRRSGASTRRFSTIVSWQRGHQNRRFGANCDCARARQRFPPAKR